MSGDLELKVGDVIGGSHKVSRCDAARLELKNPGGCLLGCGVAGVLLLGLAAVTWAGVIASLGDEGAGALLSKAGKGALVYTFMGLLGVGCLTLIQTLVIDGSARTLTRVTAFGLRRQTWPASQLEVVFAVGEPEQEGFEPCRVFVRTPAGEHPEVTLGAVAANSDQAAPLLVGGRRIAELLGLPLRVDGNAATASEALAAELRRAT